MAKTTTPATSPLASPKTRAAFLKVIRGGNRRQCAADMFGVTPSALAWYLASPAPVAAAFKAAMVKAEAEVEAEMIGCVVRAAKKGDAAAARWLEDRKAVQRVTEAILRAGLGAGK